MFEVKSINIRGRLLKFDTPMVMGIVNVTPDSFYEGSRSRNEQEILRHVRRMIRQGVDILDVGGCSTRPGSTPVSEDEEMRRLEVALNVIRGRWPDIPVSIDTFRSSVARRCARTWQIDIINDVAGGTMDSKMFETAADLQLCYVLMHMRGTPENMQQQTNYHDILAETLSYFAFKLAKLNKLGIHDVILDPGFGFAKNIDQNYQLLSELKLLSYLGCPLMAGLSRKSMVYDVLHTDPDKALNGTTVLNTIALQNGANILRVHDVAEAREAISLVSRMPATD